MRHFRFCERLAARLGIALPILAFMFSGCGDASGGLLDSRDDSREDRGRPAPSAADASASSPVERATPAELRDPKAPGPALLFKSRFGPGVSLSPPIGITSSGAWQSLVGTDIETGFSFPIAALGSDRTGLQLIGPSGDGGTPLTPGNIGEFFGNTIRNVAGPNGVSTSELFLNLKIKEEKVGKALSQIPLMINRPWTIGDIDDAYMSYWFKHPADLKAKLDTSVSSGNWRTQFEFKTGGYKDTWHGDYRIGTIILKSSATGNLFWYTKGDNVANGPWERVDYWSVANGSVPVPLGEWFKFEVFWHRSGGSDGRYWAAVNGQIIVDRWGSNLGDYKLPITRLMAHVAYTGGAGPVQGHMTDLEVWSGFPCGDGIPCYANPK